MLFSILIANYNNGIYFKDCFDSILNQTYQNFEVIIVDDASTDNSVQEIQTLIAYDPRFILYIEPQNKGCGHTKMKCVSYAKGAICGFVDPDDALTPDALEVMINAFQKHPDAAMISSKHYFTDINLTITRNSIHGRAIPEGHSFLTYGKGAVTHFAVFSLEKYKQTQGLNPLYKRAVDQDLYFIMEEVGPIHFIDAFLYLYRITDKSISANENTYKARYWHYIVMKEAYLRRKMIATSAINFTQSQFKKMTNDYFITRIKVEGARNAICKKYYFLFKSYQTSLSLDWKYKFLCLVLPKYY
jgi:glycosyltransferase involved in cell wall biosynthesis